MARQYRRNVEFTAIQKKYLDLAGDPSTPTEVLQSIADWAKVYWSKIKPDDVDSRKIIWLIGAALARNPAANVYCWNKVPYGNLEPLYKNMAFILHLLHDPGLKAKESTMLRIALFDLSWAKMESYMNFAGIDYELHPSGQGTTLDDEAAYICAMWEVYFRTCPDIDPQVSYRETYNHILGQNELGLLLMWADDRVPKESAAFLRSRAKSDSPFEPNRRRR